MNGILRRLAAVAVRSRFGVCPAPARRQRRETSTSAPVNETCMVTLSDSTMPTWSGGVLYAPYSLFDGSNNTHVNFDISFSYNRSTGQATFFNIRQFLTFDLDNNTCYNALTGEYLNGRAILRNGQVYVPVVPWCVQLLWAELLRHLHQ